MMPLHSDQQQVPGVRGEKELPPMTMQFKFSKYAFDAVSGLRYEQKPIRLPPKERGLLHLLLTARGQLVTRQELVAKVWGINETSDESVARTVYRLRQAMQASGGPEVVETVYNGGFRIIVPIRVSRLEESASIHAITQSLRPSAVTALISAREFIARRSADDIEAAAAAARLAIETDPTFSAAWSTLAEIRVFQATRSLRPPREAGWLGKEAAQAALDIDPESAAALAIRGWIRVMIDHDPERGIEDLDRSIANDSEFWVGNLLRGWAMQAVGRHSEAVHMMRRALELNAVGHSVNSILSLFLMFAGEMDEALAVATDLAKRFPTIDSAQSNASVLHAVHGRYDDAIAFGLKATALSPNTPIMHTPLAYAYAMAGRQAEAHSVLHLIETSKLPQPTAATAPVYLALGERDKAIEKLMDAKERGIPQFAWTRDDPRLAPLKGDPVVEKIWART